MKKSSIVDTGANGVDATVCPLPDTGGIFLTGILSGIMRWDSAIKDKQAFIFSRIDRLSVNCFALVFLLATLVFCFNNYYWHYPIMSYFSGNISIIFFTHLLILAGSFFYLGIHSRITFTLFHILLYNFIICLVMYATTAVQLTPFMPIDKYLVSADQALHYHTVVILDILYQYPIAVKFLCYAYNSMDIELLVLPVWLIFLQQFYCVKRYFFFILLTTLLGFSFYYFWPTMAPASVLHSVYFLPEQLNTGIKFYQLHHHISPTSGAGGLIAMPSFHIIWAILCQMSTWNVRWLWIGLLPLNILVIIAALFLGWHYFVDFFGAVLVVGVAWCVAREQVRIA